MLIFGPAGAHLSKKGRHSRAKRRLRKKLPPLCGRMPIFDPAAPKKAIPCESGEGNIQNPRYFTHKISTQTRRNSQKHAFLPSKRISMFTILQRNYNFWSGVCPYSPILRCKTTFAVTTRTELSFWEPLNRKWTFYRRGAKVFVPSFRFARECRHFLEGAYRQGRKQSF